MSRLKDLAWFEAQDPASLRRALLDPEGTRRRIESALGKQGLDAFLARAPARVVKESGGGVTDLVFLHGIMGAHLDGDAGRAWLSFGSFLTSNVASRIRLPDSEHLGPAGHLNMFYGTATAHWGDRGFRVHPISYDWRQDLVRCADGLHAAIERLAQPTDDGPRRLMIVGHSMGGVVAALYASRHPEWERHVQRVVLLGSPLRGSYAPFEAIEGTYPFFRKLAALAPRSSLQDFQQTATTLPGLLALLPHVGLDHGAELLDAANWPAGGGVPRPSQQVLDAVRALQPQISQSPLLQRTTLLASLGHGTVDRLLHRGGQLAPGPRTGKGDGTVPAASCARVAGAPTYLVQAEHSDLPGDWDVIFAVEQVANGDPPGLPVVTAADLEGTVPLVEGVARGDEARSIAAYALKVQQRLKTGDVGAEDVRWLFSPSPAPPVPPAALPARGPVRKPAPKATPRKKKKKSRTKK